MKNKKNFFLVKILNNIKNDCLANFKRHISNVKQYKNKAKKIV